MMSEWCVYTGDGPLMIMPEELLLEWEGVSEPSEGRIVSAEFRFAGEGSVATDYDFACDISDTDSGFTDFRSGWILVPGNGNGSIAFFDVPTDSAIVIVCAEAPEETDDETTFRQEYDSFTESAWKTISDTVSIASRQLVAFHSTEPGSEVLDGLTCMANPVFWPVRAGEYQMTMAVFEHHYGTIVFRNYYYRWIRNKEFNNDKP